MVLRFRIPFDASITEKRPSTSSSNSNFRAAHVPLPDRDAEDVVSENDEGNLRPCKAVEGNGFLSAFDEIEKDAGSLLRWGGLVVDREEEGHDETSEESSVRSMYRNEAGADCGLISVLALDRRRSSFRLVGDVACSG